MNPDLLEWRYLPTGNRAHALQRAGDMTALCGTAPTWFPGSWYGTGSQGEYERAAALPRCKRCLKAVAS